MCDCLWELDFEMLLVGGDLCGWFLDVLLVDVGELLVLYLFGDDLLLFYVDWFGLVGLGD